MPEENGAKERGRWWPFDRELAALVIVFVATLGLSVYGSARFPLVDDDYERAWIAGTALAFAAVIGGCWWRSARLRRRGARPPKVLAPALGCFAVGLLANHGPGLLLLANALGPGTPARDHEVPVLEKGETTPPPPLYYALLGSRARGRHGYLMVTDWRGRPGTVRLYESRSLPRPLLDRVSPAGRVRIRTWRGSLGGEVLAAVEVAAAP